MDSNELPEYYAVNDRPVKMIPTDEGGLDVLAMNLKTGEFERDMSYGHRIFGTSDIDQFTEAQFEDYVATLRQLIAARNA
jgi:hypothetical protein